MTRYANLTVTLNVPIHETEEEDVVESILKLAGSKFIDEIGYEFANHADITAAATVELFDKKDD